jgi:hypothetical protein
MKVASLEKVEFHLPRSTHVEVGGANLAIDDILISKHDNKIICCAWPRKDHNSRWLFGKNLLTTILQVRDVICPNYGWVCFVKSNGGMMFMTYEVIIGVIPNCTCSNFVSMLASLRKSGNVVPHKHLYFIYKTRMFCDHKHIISLTNLQWISTRSKNYCSERFKWANMLWLHKHTILSFPIPWFTWANITFVVNAT